MTKINRPATYIRCENCFNLFLKENRYIKREQHHFCSRSCSSQHNHKLGKYDTNKAKFKEKVLEYSKLGNEKKIVNPFKWYLRKAKDRQKLKGSETNLTLECLNDLWVIQEGKCALSGITLHLHIEHDPEQMTSASLDRIDSSKPYERSNIQFVAYPLNLAKSTFTHDQMLDFIKLIRA